MSTSPLEHIRHIVAVGSGKGGVGKSTVTMNLATTLAKMGHKVGILDADVYGPSQPTMLGVEEAEPQSDGETIQPVETYGVKLMSMGFMVDADTPLVWRGPMVQSALKQMLLNVNWGELDYLFLDLPPGTGDIQLSLAQSAPLSGAIVVCTPQDLALLDARKAVTMFGKVNIPVWGLIENMSTFICPHCGGESHIFDHGGVVKFAEKLDVPVLGQLPLDMDLRLATDSGKPVAVTTPKSQAAAHFYKCAEKVHIAAQDAENQHDMPIGADGAAPKQVKITIQ